MKDWRLVDLGARENDFLLAEAESLLARHASDFSDPTESLDPLSFRLEAEDFVALGFEGDGQIIGVVEAQLGHPHPEALVVSRIAVAVPFRFQGVGRALVEALVKRFQPNPLIAGIRSDNVRAASFWTSLQAGPYPIETEVAGAQL